jgi:dCMP deaminase
MGKPITRQNLQELGSDMRTQLGDNILAERTVGRITPDTNYVITSIGTVGEIEFLRKHTGFKLIFTDAPQRKRFEWIHARRREEDPQTWKDFLEHEKKESKGGGAKYREFDNTRKKADIILNNNSTIEDLKKKVDKIIKDVDLRPDWDNYFFGIMDAVSQRATCDRGKTAAIIVKNKMLVATGYVGAPRGLAQCDEVGHLMEKTLHDDGVERWHCVRTTHAEQNAIAQAARHGISIEGATIYMKLAPCLSCAKMIINSGIKEIKCRKQYHAGGSAIEFIKKAGIKITVIENTVEKYANQ